jgi:hypothetical protein
MRNLKNKGKAKAAGLGEIKPTLPAADVHVSMSCVTCSLSLSLSLSRALCLFLLWPFLREADPTHIPFE